MIAKKTIKSLSLNSKSQTNNKIYNPDSFGALKNSSYDFHPRTLLKILQKILGLSFRFIVIDRFKTKRQSNPYLILWAQREKTSKRFRSEKARKASKFCPNCPSTQKLSFKHNNKADTSFYFFLAPKTKPAKLKKFVIIQTDCSLLSTVTCHYRYRYPLYCVVYICYHRRSLC